MTTLDFMASSLGGLVYFRCLSPGFYARRSGGNGNFGENNMDGEKYGR